MNLVGRRLPQIMTARGIGIAAAAVMLMAASAAWALAGPSAKPDTHGADVAAARAGLRVAVAQLAVQAMAGEADAAPTPHDPPFSVYVAPLDVAETPKNSRNVPPPPVLSPRDTHSLLEDLLLAVRTGAQPVFASPPRHNIPRAKPGDEPRWRDAARKSKAILFVMASLAPAPSPPPPSSTEPPGASAPTASSAAPATPPADAMPGWLLEISVRDTETDRIVGTARAFLPGER